VLRGEPDSEHVLARRLAVLAPVLYLLNLLLLPGLAFLVLAWLFIKYRKIDAPVAAVQLQQNFFASIVAGAALIGISFVIIAIGGFSSVYSWMVMLLYALSIHATLVLLGVVCLSRGLNQQAFVYPGLGRIRKAVKGG